MAYSMTQWYIFKSLKKAELLKIQNELRELAQQHDMCGLILIAEEGCNGTVAGSKEAIDATKKYLTATFQISNFQNWESDVRPFRRFKVDVRNEIVALKKPVAFPLLTKERLGEVSRNADHLSPTDFHAALQRKDVTVLDTRNWYETDIGTFKNSLIPNIKSFQDFPEFVQKSNIPKDKKVVMFCTSGIRCEKAAEEMRSQGYKEVFQLDGGITNYLKEYPEGAWQGECFMFDHRVAVDSNLQPSKRYGLCRMCGNPGDIQASCSNCSEEHRACASCIEKNAPYCSRQCKHILQKKTPA